MQQSMSHQTDTPFRQLFIVSQLLKSKGVSDVFCNEGLCFLFYDTF